MSRLEALLSDESAPLRWGVFFFIFTNALDLFSTWLGMHVHGVYEDNPFMRDPVTLKFILINGVFVKSVGMLLLCVMPAVFLYRATASHLVASLPFWFWGMHVLPIVLANFILIWTTF